MKWWVRCRVLKVGTTDLYRQPCVYLFNHRSWCAGSSPYLGGLWAGVLSVGVLG